MTGASPSTGGWRALLADPHPFRGDERFPLPAYSEFMPGPLVALKPAGWIDPWVRATGDDYGFRISEYQDAYQLRPGLHHIGRALVEHVQRLARGGSMLSRDLLHQNEYFPPELASRVASLPHARHVVIASLALSRTQDDKGRVRWTAFGGSELGPARAFWESFWRAPDDPLPEDEGLAILAAVLAPLGVRARTVAGIRRVGVRILPFGHDPDHPAWGHERVPPWARDLVMRDEDDVAGVAHVVTFRPFARLPQPIRRRYLAGTLSLVPFPGSLVFFGHRGYLHLERELPLAMQIPMLRALHGRHAAPLGMRVPQSGWLDEPGPKAHRGPHGHGAVVSTVKRTHRWDRAHRDEDDASKVDYADRVTDALFSTDPVHMDLYDKPMARNAQVWTRQYRLLLDGPSQGRFRIEEAARALYAGGHFGYRFQFPPMRVGRHDLYWHRPLVASFGTKDDRVTVAVGAEEGAPLGFLTAYARGEHGLDVDAPVLLWPRIDRREAHVAAVEIFADEASTRRHVTTFNVRKLLEAREILDAPLPEGFARALLTADRETTLDTWLRSLPKRASDAGRARKLVKTIRSAIDTTPPKAVSTRTFVETATRAFEARYWRTIAELSTSHLNTNQADVATGRGRARPVRDLEAIGDGLHAYYARLIARHGMRKRAVVGDHAFRWTTDFDFPWSEGWSRSQTGHGHERNIVVIIPGRDRGQAVIMADHYDTAYMEDVYAKSGKRHERLAARGADDNFSATSALMLAADVLLPMSREGKLARDVWLVHLTGEEFPADSLGARHLVQRLIEDNLSLQIDGEGPLDLAGVRVSGAYILDMIAHNNPHARYGFQISPGEGAAAMELARIAHDANARWNAAVPAWNQASVRAKAAPFERVKGDSLALPRIAPHPRMLGEVRPYWHFASTVFNTDAVVFSDAGIPVVLFMESYDIGRTGYHDSKDTMANIDLDYGAALAAIAIESDADAAGR